jgi:hypothetical protein
MNLKSVGKLEEEIHRRYADDFGEKKRINYALQIFGLKSTQESAEQVL